MTERGGDGMLININRADAEELQALEGIGAKRAAAIVGYRERRGWFSIPEDIKKVRGIGEKTFQKIRHRIVTH